MIYQNALNFIFSVSESLEGRT